MHSKPDYCLAIILTVVLSLTINAQAQNVMLDAPHDQSSDFSGGCLHCHQMTAYDQPNMIPPSGVSPNDIDDTLYNNVCWKCHIGVNFIPTHSSLTTTASYGDWTIECIVCHNQHTQEQDDAFGTTYGKFIRTTIDLSRILDNVPPMGTTVAGKSGTKTVILKDDEGPNSLADGDLIYDGICEVCHTKTSHFRNDGSGNDQLHTNISIVAGTSCTICHKHSNGFIHGGGSTVCETCHNSGSHITHISATNAIGPSVSCTSCHDITNMPYFKSGPDGNGDGNIDLSETTICDPCHSPDGSFDGVDDAAYGARTNWTDGVYTGNVLTSGKEKWCVSCHDLGTSIIKGRQAPDIAGDNSNYGYYVSGHGMAGAAEECGACHGLDMDHNFDGKKTYLGEGLNDTFTQDPLRTYKLGFRLKDVGGMDPLVIPLPNTTGYVSDSYKLCYSCHDEQTLMSDTRDHGCYSSSGSTANPFENAAAITTQFRNMHKEGHDTGDNDMPANFHADHLIDAGLTGQLWYSNGPGTGTGRSANSCPMCHNPHGDKLSDNSATIAMTVGAFGVSRGSDAYGDYGEVTDYSPFDDAEGNPQRRCVITCHTFGRNGTSQTDTNTKWYYNPTPPNSITLSDNTNDDPGPADPGFTNSTEISVRPYSLSFSPKEIMCAEDAAFTINATPWDVYLDSNPPYTYTLLPGEGSRTVYCQLRNTTHGQLSAVLSATITVDTTPPVDVFATTLTSPNGAEIFAQGSDQNITWNDADFSGDTTLKADPVTLEYSTDSGATFPNEIATDLSAASPYTWTLPAINETTVRVRLTVTDQAGNQASDTSDADFTIQ